MLDFSQIKTPAEHGRVLLVPDAAGLSAATHANHSALDAEHVPLLDSTLAECRREVRSRLTGDDDQLIIVTGHDPGFIHPGVWAKHIVVSRLAAAMHGTGINLVVDSDSPKATVLAIPSVIDGNVTATSIPSVPIASGISLEDAKPLGADELADWCGRIESVLGDRFAASQMPRFRDGLRTAPDKSDWVDQLVAARVAIEADLGVALANLRISRVWHSPLLLDMLLNADRFASSYNRALAGYRKSNRVRGASRPIPDLRRTNGRQEAAVWVHRPDKPRRRLFVECGGSTLTLFAENTELCTIPVRELQSCGDLETLHRALGSWRIRPRALTLTLWARLLLADLFVHGIGGAKYDRITDAIIADYYRVAAPAMACASATLHLDLPTNPMTAERFAHLRQDARRFQFNPQRGLDPSDDLNSLLVRRERLVERSGSLRDREAKNHKARREVFNEIRQVSAELHTLRPDALTRRQSELSEAAEALARNQVATGREYFFGLYDRARLEILLGTLPTIGDFAV
jgi:hypothetical protein